MIKNEIDIDQNFMVLFEPHKYRHVLFHGGRGGGKSTHFALSRLEKCRQTENYKILCLREIQNSISESVHSLLKELILKYNMVDFEVTEKTIRNKITGSYFTFKGALRNINSLQSFQGYNEAWLEEAQAFSLKVLNILIPTIREAGSTLYYSMNRFADNDAVWQLIGQYGDSDEDVFVKKVNITDLHKKFQNIELLKERAKLKTRDYNAFLHIWEGEPLGQDPNSAISRHKVIGAMNRVIDKPEGGRAIGADIARYGDDLIVFYERQGFKVIKSKINSKQGVDQTAADLMDFAGHDKKVPINVDDTGVGGGVTDILKTNKYNVFPFNNGGKDHLEEKEKDKYANNITKMWMEFAKIIDKVDIPNDEDLKAELSTRLYYFTKDQKKIIEPKDDFKKRYSKSPDKADGLLLTFAMPKPVHRPTVRWG